MAVYVFKAEYLITAKSRPIIVEAESLEDAEEEACTIMFEQGTANLVDDSSFSTEFQEITGIYAR